MTAERPRLAVRLTPDGLRQVLGGHPWVFEGSITGLRPEAGSAAGDLAVIFDSKRNFAAIGLYDPTSPIRIRVLHTGGPRTIDDAFWSERIGAALARRAPLVADPDTTAYRLVHGENDSLPGLVVDRYDDTLVVKLYTPAWFSHLDAVVGALVAVVAPSTVVLRLARVVQRHAPAGRADGATLLGDAPAGPVPFVEGGLRYAADVVSGQKTGHFLDQRDNRARVRSLASGTRMLDMFSCTGGFSVSAAVGGARSVHSVDISPWAIDATRQNMVRNRSLVAGLGHQTTVGDAVSVLRDLGRAGERFDLVVVDPPSFASKATQVAAALGAYGSLTEAALGVIDRGVLVLASCSSRISADQFFETVHRSADRAGRPLDEIERTSHGVDHPVGFVHGAYLKALFARVG